MLMVSCLCVYILKYFGMMLWGQIIKNEKKKGPSATVVDKFIFICLTVKSPSSDLTWNKGAKRLMANLDR